MYTIYLIENTANSKMYVGVTSKTLKHRLSKHISSSVCGSKRALQSAIRKYGKDAFKIYPLQNSKTKDRAFELEKYWISLLNTYEGNHGYNMTTGGASNFSHSEETCQKIGDAHKGKNISDDTRKKLSDAHQGTQLSEKRKQNISEALSGRQVSKQTREKIGEIHRGKVVSKETRGKISRALKGKQLSREHKQAIRNQCSKLSVKQAAEIKWLLENTSKTQKEISSVYPISQRIVSDINTGKIWKEVEKQKPNI